MKLVKATIVLAFFAGFLLSPRLWINDGRLFPLISPIDGIPALTATTEIILISLFLGLSIFWIFYDNKAIGISLIGILLVILIQDQMRWQPWVYLYLLLLLPFLIQSTDKNIQPLLACLQWIVAGAYVWSGIHKFNPAFIDKTFAEMLHALGMNVSTGHWKETGYAIPFTEILIGVGLLIPTCRKIAVVLAILMHLFILFYLRPVVLNHNSVVYPWNIAMIIFVCLLFWGVPGNPLNPSPLRPNFLLALPLLLVWIFPALNFFGYWDHYLSFSLYSDKPSNYYIAVEKGEIDKIDKRFENYFANIPGLQGGELIDVNKWSYSELNVPFYPEMRLFKKLSKTFCELGIDEDKLVFLELSYSGHATHYTRFTCKETESR